MPVGAFFMACWTGTGTELLTELSPLSAVAALWTLEPFGPRRWIVKASGERLKVLASKNYAWDTRVTRVIMGHKSCKLGNHRIELAMAAFPSSSVSLVAWGKRRNASAYTRA